MVPRAALEQDRAQRRIAAVVDAGVRRLWARLLGRTWSQAWAADVGPSITVLIETAQVTVAARSAAYATEVLAELDIPVEVPTVMLPEVFAGAAGDGRPVATLVDTAIPVAVDAFHRDDVAELAAAQREARALAEAEEYIAGITAAILADTMRAAEEVAFAQRPWVDGYIRMIEAGACSRCAVLAGQFYLFNDGFLRHPRCRCTHIPYAENAGGDERTDPKKYFESLTAAQQDKVFTIAGAEAIRLGADIGQVVNARRGMSTAQRNPRGWIPKGRLIPVDVHGRPTYVTSEGTTRMGSARRAMGRRPVRLMPESILQLADSAEERIELLKLYGFIN